MYIKTTTVLAISDENLGLIQIVANKMGYQSWVKTRLAKDPNLPTDVNTFIQELLTMNNLKLLRSMIVPPVQEWFGLQAKGRTDKVLGELNQALVAKVEITEEEPKF